MTAAPVGPPDADKTLNKALSLADKGYHVFPVKVTIDPATGANTKTYVTGRKDSPTGANWNATRDPELIRSWWGPDGRFRDCMIGVSTEPSGVVLMDLDTKPHGGIAQDGPGEWAALHPQPYPLPAAVGTSSTGGKHLPYRADPKRPVRTTAGELAPGVDTRGIGGMFVCWSPWLPKVADLPMVPDVVPDQVPHLEQAPLTPARVDRSTFAALNEVQARVLHHRDIVADAEQGQGVRTASRQAYFVGQYIGAGQVDEAWAAGVLLDALSGWTWDAPGDERKLREQILKGIKDGVAEPRAWESAEKLASVTVLNLPDGPGKGHQGGTEGQQEASPEGRRISLLPASQIRLRRVRWLWDGRWALGTIALVAGKQGLGKSTIVYDRAARITRGELEGEFHGQPKSVLACATEDSWECTIAPRLIAAGADLDRVFKVDAVQDEQHSGLILPHDVLGVEQVAGQVDAALLILDPLTSRLSVGLDSHKDSETRRALEPLADMADRARLCVVGLMHLNKGGKTDPMDAVMASTAFTAVARSVSIAMYDPDDEDGRRRLFGTPKNNLGRTDLPTMAFVTVGHDVQTDDGPTSVGRIEWVGEIEGSIADAMERATQDPETRTTIGDAAKWLGEHLRACGGQADSEAVRSAGKSEGFHPRTLQRALKRIGGRAESVPNSFPRRNLYTLPVKRDKAVLTSLMGSGDTQTRPLSTSTKTVVSVVTVATRDDSDDRSDRISGREDAVASAVAPVSTPAIEAAPVPPAGPPWLAELTSGTAPAAPAGSEPEPEPACPCGRSATLHSRSNWKTCTAGHRWHAFGHRALPRCPQCPPPATGGDAA